MCGIFGYFDRNGEDMPPHVLQKMGEEIRHRGPDDNGVFVGKGVGIGNQRLSIIDINGGRQPFVSDDGRIAVVQNGEIFNYIELAGELSKDAVFCKTHSDTEVLLRLYEHEGIKFVSRLNGMFSFSVFDQKSHELFLVRDRVGVKPLYIYDDGSRLLFASEIKSLLKAGAPAELDMQALDLFLSYNFIPPPYTLFKNIRHLMPGHLLRITKNKTVEKCWWDLTSLASEESRPESYWVDEFNATLDDAVRIRMRSDAPYGAFLSGGVDSSSVVGLMARYFRSPVKTYSIGFHDLRFDESRYALEASDRFGTDHHLEKVNLQMLDLWPLVTYHCDQPHGDVSFLPTYRVSQLAARDVKMVLTGDGGDELFAGYDKYQQFFSSTKVDEMSEADFFKYYSRQISLFSDEKKKLLYSQSTREAIRNYNAWDILAALLDRVSHMDRVNQALLVDVHLLLPGNNLVKPDRMAMAVSLETRTPFLDYRMVEMAFRMPGNMKLRNGETKYIFKKAVEPLIGRNLAYRKKQMFTVPIGEWFKTELYDMMADLLLSVRATRRGLFNVEYLSKLIEDHVSGVSNYTREIRALMALEIWFRVFIDGDDVSSDFLRS